MSRDGKFLGLQSEEGEQKLLSWRNGLAVGKNPLVVLVVRQSAVHRVVPRNGKDTDEIQACSIKVFEQTNAAFAPASRQVYPYGVACAWYEKTLWFDAIVAAAEIRENLRCLDVHARNAAISVASHEHAAFRLARLAGPEQVVVDPSLWKRLTLREQRLAGVQGLHVPTYEEKDRASQAITEKIAGLIDDYLAWESSELGATVRKPEPVEALA